VTRSSHPLRAKCDVSDRDSRNLAEREGFESAYIRQFNNMQGPRMAQKYMESQGKSVTGSQTDRGKTKPTPKLSLVKNNVYIGRCRIENKISDH